MRAAIAEPTQVDLEFAALDGAYAAHVPGVDLQSLHTDHRAAAGTREVRMQPLVGKRAHILEQPWPTAETDATREPGARKVEQVSPHRDAVLGSCDEALTQLGMGQRTLGVRERTECSDALQRGAQP